MHPKFFFSCKFEFLFSKKLTVASVGRPIYVICFMGNSDFLNKNWANYFGTNMLPGLLYF